MRSRRQSRSRGRRRGDRLVAVGAVLFLLGALAVAGFVLPYFLAGGSHRPLAVPLLFLADLAPLGLAVALVGMLLQVRARRPNDGALER